MQKQSNLSGNSTKEKKTNILRPTKGWKQLSKEELKPITPLTEEQLTEYLSYILYEKPKRDYTIMTVGEYELLRRKAEGTSNTSSTGQRQDA